MQHILVTGANGQIGNDLVSSLRSRYGAEIVVGADLKLPEQAQIGPHEVVDITHKDQVDQVIKKYRIGVIYHLASLLSARGEQFPHQTWDVNLNGLKTILDLAAKNNCQVFWPSSIAVFGPNTPNELTPQYTVLEPTTMYGLTKRSGELLCSYYHRRFGVDVRSVRYPGLVSFAAPPGGGTTDYAVDMLRAAVEENPYVCFVEPDTRLPMMYMPDAIQAVIDLMHAPINRISVRTSYNISAFSFTVTELEAEIKKSIPGFSCSYVPDYRNEIAASWPSSIDDSMARADWDWLPAYSLSAMVKDMIEKLKPALTP